MTQRYVSENISLAFNKNSLPSGKDLVSPVIIFIFWVIPAFLFVIFVEYISYYHNTDYFGKAITEGIGPVLWNVISTFGVLAFGLAITFPTKITFRAANSVLENGYAIGCLTIGLILGKIMVTWGETSTFIEGWRTYLFGFGILLSVFMVALMNLAVWYLSFLSDPDGKLFIRIKNTHWFFRLSIGVLLTLVSSIALWQA